jgi:predicted TIM-barrel fold metal-dependent hydrolase
MQNSDVKNMKIIDFRFRPPFSSFLDGWLYDVDFLADLSRRFNSTVPEAAKNRSVEQSIAEMDDAGVTYGVIPGRTSFGMDNGDLVKIMDAHPGKFISLAGLDPLADREATKAEIEKYVLNGPCAGVALEPGYAPEPLACDDGRLFHIYDLCQELNVPMLLSHGGLNYPSLRYFRPETVDNVAEYFPNLKIVLAHGGFPWVQEVCWIAYHRPNFYLSPDLYAMCSPGATDYIAGANGIIYDKVIFGSAYPVVQLKDCVQYYLNSGIREENLEYVMYKNAAKVLNLE